MIRKATGEDKSAIFRIYRNAIVDMDSKGIFQWDEVYPNEENVDRDICNGQAYVYVDENTIKGVVVLNEHQDKEYEDLHWQYTGGKQLVVHRLCVDPRHQKNGIARQLMDYAEKYGVSAGYTSIRLDAFLDNARAWQLYEKLGYAKVGIVKFRKGLFYCYEKKL